MSSESHAEPYSAYVGFFSQNAIYYEYHRVFAGGCYRSGRRFIFCVGWRDDARCLWCLDFLFDNCCLIFFVFFSSNRSQILIVAHPRTKEFTTADTSKSQIWKILACKHVFHQNSSKLSCNSMKHASEVLFNNEFTSFYDSRIFLYPSV